MRVIGKGACDPCANDWKLKIKELWEKYQNVVKSIKADNQTYYPDGQGQVSIPGLAEASIIDMSSYYILTLASDIPAANLTDKTTYWTLQIGQ